MLESIDVFFRTYKDLIEGVSKIAGVLSLLLTATALLFTGLQIRGNKRQLKGKSIYDIQKDARAVAHGLFEDKDVAKVLLSKDITQEDLVFASLGQFFNFYAAVYQQRRLHVLDSRLWKPFEIEVEFLIKLPKAQEFWERKKDAGEYDSAFVKLINNILKRYHTSDCATPNVRHETLT